MPLLARASAVPLPLLVGARIARQGYWNRAALVPVLLVHAALPWHLWARILQATIACMVRAFRDAPIVFHQARGPWAGPKHENWARYTARPGTEVNGPGPARHGRRAVSGPCLRHVGRPGPARICVSPINNQPTHTSAQNAKPRSPPVTP